MSGKVRNYQNGKFYRVVDKSYQMCYIGSTIEKLANRMNAHKSKYKKYKENIYNRVAVYDIFDAFGMENCKIELIEFYPCNSKEELYAREGYHQQQENCVNKYIAGRTGKEPNNCQCGCMVQTAEKARHHRSLKHQKKLNETSAK